MKPLTCITIITLFAINTWPGSGMFATATENVQQESGNEILKTDSLLALIPRMAEDTSLTRHYSDIAIAYLKNHEFEKAIQMATRSLDLSKKLQFKKGMARAMLQLGTIKNAMDDYETALEYYHAAIDLALQSGDTGQISASYLGTGYLHYNKGMYETAMTYYQQALLYSLRLNDAAALQSIYNNIGVCYEKTGNYFDAVTNYLISLKISERLGNTITTAHILGNIGEATSELGNHGEAINYHRRALLLEEQAGDHKGIALTVAHIGQTYARWNKIDSAIYYYRIALQKNYEIKNNRTIANIYNNLANNYLKLNQLDSAIVNSEKSYSLRKEMDDKSGIISSAITRGKIYMRLAKSNKKYYPHALQSFEEGLRIAKENKSNKSILSLEEALAGYYYATGQYDKAYQYQSMYSRLSDSINKINYTDKVAEMQTKYETAKKDKEIAQNNLTLKQQDLELTKKSATNKLLLAGVAVLLLFVLFGAVTFIQRQKLMKQQKETEKQRAIEQTRAAIAGDLHDDIGATLSSVQIMSTFAVNAIDNNSPDARQWVQRIGDNTGDMLQNIRDIVWTLNPANDNAEELLLRMRQFATQILEPKNIQYTFDSDEKVTGHLNRLIAKRNILLIFKEALNNTAKYSGGSLVRIEFGMRDSKCLMTIADNGKGFDSLSLSAGNGLKNMKKRAAQLNGTVDIKSAYGSGTTVTLVC